MSAHTLGKLYLDEHDQVYRKVTRPDGYEWQPLMSIKDSPRNRRRFVACWNACEEADITNPEAIPELIQVLRARLNDSEGMNEEHFHALNNALAKLEDKK